MKTRWLNAAGLIAVCLLSAAIGAMPTITTDASFAPDESRITGHVSIPIDEYTDADTMYIRLYPNRFIVDETDTAGRVQGVTVDSIFMNQTNLTPSMWLSEDRVHAGVPLSSDEAGSLELYFHAVIPDQRERFGYFDDQYVLEGWIPVPAPRRDGNWLLVEYQTDLTEPVGDFFNFEVRLSMADSMDFIAPGVYDIESSDSIKTIRQRVERVIDAPAVISAKYLQDTTRIGDVLHRVYYSSEHAWITKELERWVEQTFEYMGEHVMPYPYDEFVTVIGGFYGGGALEQPQMIWMNKPSVGFLYTDWYRLAVVHEAIHQWFYGIIASNQARHPWMDESLAEHFTVRALDYALANERHILSTLGWHFRWADLHRIGGAVQFELYPVNLEVYRYGWGNYSTVVYMKGARILETIEGLVGEARVDSFWHDYAGRYAFDHPLPEDFYALADTYMDAPSGTAESIIGVVTRPDFEISEILSTRHEDDSAGVMYTSEVEYRIKRPLGLSVDLRLEYADGHVFDTTVEAYRGISTLERDYEAPIQTAIIDPEYKYAIDENFFNNSRSVERVNGSGLRLFSGATFLVESLFSYLWGW